MLRSIREWLTVILIAALPFHALFVTLGTKLLVGPGHAPLPVLALWKEGVLGVILLIALVELVRTFPRKWDRIDVLILALIALSVIVTAGTHGDWGLYLLGFKYDFLPLVAFVILRRVSWSQHFRCTILQVLFGVGAIVAAYGIITLFLPASFFTALGYSDLHSLYVPGASLAAFQHLGGSAMQRIQSTMSGPNQLGLWLLLPFGIALVSQMQTGVPRRQLCIIRAVTVLLSVALLLTFSRAAWIAAAVIAVAVLSLYLPRAQFRVWAVRLGCGALGAVVIAALVAPNLILRAASSRDHLLRPLAAVRMIAEHPLGLGLGTAGPASNRVSDACVMLEEGVDASWAANHPDLCVFVGDQQVQPADRDCTCPLLPENWYLQIGVELGVLGFALFAALVAVLLVRMYATQKDPDSVSIFLSFLGISIAALFLHAWEDAAVASSVWVLLAAVLPARRAS